MINNIQTLLSNMDSTKTTPQLLKCHALDSRMTDLTDLDEKVEGRNLNLESNAPKGQFTPVRFLTDQPAMPRPKGLDSSGTSSLERPEND